MGQISLILTSCIFILSLSALKILKTIHRLDPAAAVEVMILPQRCMRQYSITLHLWREVEVPASVRCLTGLVK